MRKNERVNKTRVSLFCCALLVVALGSPFLRAQDTEITNARVIEMAKIGLDDDIIIAKIKAASCKFQLSDSDLIDLKRAGVSSKVVAAMLDASVITVAKVTIDKHPVAMHTLGQAKVGGRLGNIATLHMKSVKEKAYLQNPHSEVLAGASPEIIVELPKSDTIDNYIVVELDGKGDRRELEVGSAEGAIIGAKKGIRAEAIRNSTASALGNGKYRLSPEKSLRKGEYIVYVVGSADYEKGIFGRGYDFTVGAERSENAQAPVQATPTSAPIQAATIAPEVQASAKTPALVQTTPEQPQPTQSVSVAQPQQVTQGAGFGPARPLVGENITATTATTTQSLADVAKRLKQHKACLALAKDNPAITCQ